MKREYKCIFFDLDHTLWDYERNSQETLDELYEKYSLSSRGVTSCELLKDQFRKVNITLWELYDRGEITSDVIRQQRFKQILEHFSVMDEQLTEELSVDYLHSCPNKGHLVPYAIETLDYLASKYEMTVITNGFDEIQNLKLSAGNLHQYFKHIVTSQKAGHRKPSRGIFDYAMEANNVRPHESIMVGDNLITDIAGATRSSIDAVFYNPEKVSHDVNVPFEIHSLKELQLIL